MAPAYVQGPIDVPLVEETIANRLATVVAKYPDRVAVLSSKGKLTYSQIDLQSDAIAISLRDSGLRPSDRVAICIGNLAEYVVLIHACAKLGAVVVPMSTAYTEVQLVSAINHITASCLVLSTDISLPYKSPKSAHELFGGIIPKENRRNKVPSVKQLLVIDNSPSRCYRGAFPDALWFDDVLNEKSGQKFQPQTKLTPSDIINIQFTSGTTSSPKAACLTHKGLLNNAIITGNRLNLTELDVLCCVPPIYHAFALSLGVLSTMAFGCTLLLPSESFNPKAVVDSIIDHQATVIYGVPTMFLAELEEAAQRGLGSSSFSSLRTGLIAGSIVPPVLRAKLKERMNLSGLLNMYGMTELSPSVSTTCFDDDVEKHHNTVGTVLPHTEIRIVSRDDCHQTLRKGERGELLIGGYLLMKGYWEDEKRTLEALVMETGAHRGGLCPSQGPKTWLRTGDEAVIRSDGRLQITGRIKDIIIRGGENIYPSEIENLLLQHDLINGVAVVGLPDDRYGEIIAAFIIPHENALVSQHHDTSAFDLRTGSNPLPCVDSRATGTILTGEDIRCMVRSTLGKSSAPKYIFWTSKIPLTATGKTEKYKLREIGEIELRKRAEDPAVGQQAVRS
ncbi:hypothetical protein TWF481_006531 [Arthrobotrys musiformis]|uniref:Acetyl-CoA synthetase-like protein n=1 Tax=Arthrobotrys musiformis TaxID=47236 RepID=A0AAV9W8R7_9PEZI